MFEVMELMKEKNYQNRIFPVLYTTDIYKPEGRIKYIQYWEEQYFELKEKMKDLQIENATSVAKNLKEIRDISASVGEFLDLVADMNNPAAENIEYEIEKELKKQGIQVIRRKKEFKPNIIVIAGSAGGVGKSFVAGCLSYALKKRLARKVLCISLGALDNAQTFLGLEENNEDKIQVCEKVYAHRTSSGVDFICRDEMFRYRMELEMMMEDQGGMKYLLTL